MISEKKKAPYYIFFGILIFLLITPHTVYLFYRYIPLTLATDQIGAAIAVLITENRKISKNSIFQYRVIRAKSSLISEKFNGEQEIGFSNDFLLRSIGDQAYPTRSIACSFWLMEDLWKNCHAIYLGITDVNNLNKISTSIEPDLLVAKNPCAYLSLIKNSELKNEVQLVLQCNKNTSYRYEGIVYYGFMEKNSSVELLNSIKGELK